MYYLLRKSKGLSVDGHPVVRSLVEIRLFLEKVNSLLFEIDSFCFSCDSLAEASSSLDADSASRQETRLPDTEADEGFQ